MQSALEQGTVPEPVSKLFTSIGDLRSTDVESQTALVFFTSLAFLLPAFTCWRAGRLWHAWVFSMMTVLCGAFHLCTADEPDQWAACSADTTSALHRAYRMWVHFCFLQLAFCVVGPEDPQLQHVSEKPTWSRSVSSSIPWDVVVVSRVMPLTVLILFNAAADSQDVSWQNILLTETLLIVCSGAFWLHWTRRNYAPEVLLRLRFWHRLLHYGSIPAMMLFWIFCLMSFTDQKVLHSLLHIVIAAFALSIFRTVHPESPSAATDVMGTSCQNPLIAHILMASNALVVLPTALIGASYDWCPSVDGSHIWPTISSTMVCQPGGYYIAIVAVPTYTATAVVFSVIGSIDALKKPWEQFNSCPVEIQDHFDLHVHGSRQRLLGKHVGCLLGYAGAALGIISSLTMRGSAAQELVTFFCGMASLLALSLGAVLTALCSDPTVPGFDFRRRFTLFICFPVVAINVSLTMSSKVLPSTLEYSPAIYAMSEYAILFVLPLWPLTWAAEVQEEGARKARGLFSWPVTNWRFD